MRFSATTLVALLAGTALALPSTSHVVHEKRDQLGAAAGSLAKKSIAPAGHVMPMKVALTQKNLDQIPKLLDDVTNPASPRYGKHWDGDELARHFAPADTSIRAVRNWLTDAGIKAKLSANRHWIEFEATVEQAERLLKTQYHIYGISSGGDDNNDGEERIGCDDYSLPRHVSEHVDFIHPTVSTGELRRSVPRQKKRAAASANNNNNNNNNGDDSLFENTQHTHFQPIGTDGAQGTEEPIPFTVNTTKPSVNQCSQGATPDCIRAIYGIPEGTTATKGNELGIYEAGDYYDQLDLDIFFTNYAPRVSNGTGPVLNNIDSSNTTSSGSGSGSSGGGVVGGESVLDLEIAFPIVHPQGVRLLQVDDAASMRSGKKGHLDSLLDALDADFCSFMGGDNSTYDFAYPDSSNATSGGYNGTKMCGTYQPPTVISISYGYQEASFSPAYLTRQCLEFAKLAMAGTTVIASSGDTGVSAPMCANPKMDVSSPQFPASCPYVTAVGATKLNPNATSLTRTGSNNDGEELELVGADPMSGFKGGSGFSTVFAMPDWQKTVVPPYLASVASWNSSAAMQPGINFNASGRAYPDVSALGTHISTITNGVPFLADGTSASAPLFASMITLVNEMRMAKGKGPVGFINPALYRAGLAAASPSYGSASASQGNTTTSKVFNDILTGDNSGCGMPGFKATKGWDAVTGWGSPQWEGLSDLLVNL